LIKAKHSAYMMFWWCYSMNMHNVHMQCHLFYSLFKPTMNHGCDNWGPHVMAKKKSVSESVDGEVMCGTDQYYGKYFASTNQYPQQS
jgi:hypothetical protein